LNQFHCETSLIVLTSFWIPVSFYIGSFLILNLINFLRNWEFTMPTNFLTRVITKTFTFILISTLPTLVIGTIHPSDALALDTSFGGDGKVTISFSAGDDVGSGVAVQADDKIVVVGTRDNGSGTSEFAVARYLLDLPLDGGDDGGGGGGGSSCFIATAADGSLTQP